MRPLPQRVRARLGGEQGFALVMALALMVVLTVASTTAIYVTSSSSRGSGRSSQNQTAYSLAEAGIDLPADKIAVGSASIASSVCTFGTRRTIMITNALRNKRSG